MPIAINAIERAFETRLTNLATNTTLGTATRHDFAAITINIPENTSRTFRSVFVELTLRDVFTVATTYTNVRCGIKLGAVAFTDTDLALPLANSADHETLGPLLFDVTSYFNTNFGAGTSQTCQVGVAVSTDIASNINIIAAKLYITYEADNAATTKVRTVRIPIQSHHTIISTSDVEIGTTGGVSDAPVNQIPQLTGVGGFLPESTVGNIAAFVEVWCADAGNAVTNFNFVAKIDSGGSDITRGTIDQTLNTNTVYHDIITYDTGTYSPGSAHAFICRSSLASRFEFIAAWLTVTYTYNDAATTREVRSLILPIEAVDSDTIQHLQATIADDRERWQCTVDIVEPGTITLLQSGVFFEDLMSSAAAIRTFAPGQTERVNTHLNIAISGQHYFMRRTDHDTGWTLARGTNKLYLDVWVATVSLGSMTGRVFLNYQCDRTLNGNVSAPYLGVATQATSNAFTTVSDLVSKPVIPETEFQITGILNNIFGRSAGGSQIPLALLAERNTGESGGDGWWIKHRAGSGNVENGTRSSSSDWTHIFNKSHLETDKGDIEATRRWRLWSSISMIPSSMLWVTHHAIKFAVAGTITAANGTVIQVWDTVTNKLVGQGTVTSNAFSINVMSNVNQVFVTSPTGRSANGTAGSSSFNISSAGDTGTGGRFNRGFN